MSYILMQQMDSIKNSCILCGRCTAACPSFKHGGIDPMEIMAGGEEGFDQCIVCGTCSRVCHRSDPFTVVRDAIVIDRGIHVSDLFRETGYIRAPAEDRLIDPVWTGSDAYIMSGCVVESMVPYLEYAGSIALHAIGLKVGKLPKGACCLHPIQFMEMPMNERREFRKGLCESAEGKPIVTLCPGCNEELEVVSQDVSHIIMTLYENLDRLPRFETPLKVGMEPGCSAESMKKEMKAVLERMNCVIVNDTFGCCGKNAPVSEPLMLEREEECAGADVIVVGCPMCLVKYDSQSDGIPTVHISELVAMATGHAESLGFHKIPLNPQ